MHEPILVCGDGRDKRDYTRAPRFPQAPTAAHAAIAYATTGRLAHETQTDTAPHAGANPAHAPTSHGPKCPTVPRCAEPPPRRPDQQNGSHYPVAGGVLLSNPFVNANFVAVPTEAVRGIPDGKAHRLQLIDYHLPCDTLPNSLGRPTRILGEGVLRVGADFHLLARIVQNNEGTRLLEVLAQAYDMSRRAPANLSLDPGLLGATYHLLARAHVAARAKRHSQSREGRN